MRKPFVIYPILYVLHLLLHFLYYNFSEISLSAFVILAISTLAFALIVLKLASILFKDSLKAGLAAFIFLIIFFNYWFVRSITSGRNIEGFMLDRHRLLIPLLILFFVFCLYFIWKRRLKLFNFTRILNVIAFVSICVVAVNIAKVGLRPSSIPLSEKNEGKKSELLSPGIFPDIYYIILDAYTSLDILKDYYGYDNSEFAEYLTKKGFYIASDSNCNYANTNLSLASSLNMTYLNSSDLEAKRFTRDLLYVRVPYEQIQKNNVVRLLKSKGYKYVHISGGTGAIINPRYSDISYGKEDALDFFLSRTIIGAPAVNFNKNKVRGNILYAFDKLTEMPDMNGPKFVFAHIVCPHHPFVFGANGEKISQINPRQPNEKNLYLNQVIFVNKKITQVIDKILLKSKIPPIIIMQGDHGYVFPEDKKQYPKAWLKEQFKILNAYYLPNGGNKLLYNSITPVNTFRMVFNYYFDSKYVLLSDESYCYTTKKPFKFINVTAEIK